MTLPPNAPPLPDPKANSASTMLAVILYTAGSALNSMRALSTLKDICEEHFQGRYQIEVVDILEEPLRALADRILVTPTLVRTAPEPRLLIVGSLSDRETVVLALLGTDARR